MLAHDGVQFFDAFFASSKLGAVFAPLSWRSHPREVEAHIRLVRPEILFFDDLATGDGRVSEPIAGIMDHLSSLHGMPELHPCSSLEAICADTGDVHLPDDPLTCESVTESDIACLLFTSGARGWSGAAQISHRQIAWNTLNTHLGDLQSTDTFLNVFPLFHSAGLFGFSLPILILGGTIIQPRRFDPAQILAIIERERVSIFAGVPTMFHMLTTTPGWDRADLGSLRFCLSGGAPMPVSLIERYQHEKNVVFRQGYGMTQFGPAAFSLPAEDAVRKAGSIGKPSYFVDARVVDPELGTTARVGEVGELVLRGPSAFSGYFGDQAASREAFDHKGYFRTGDLARIDSDGYFHIVERLEDVFVSGGENVYPTEIEAALHRHPAVALCAVVGKPDPRWGAVGVAFVVPQPDYIAEHGAVTVEALLAHLGERLARYKIPRELRLVDDLPLSGVGMVRKDILRSTV